MFNKGDYAKILDKATGKVIAAGEIIAKKESDEDTVTGHIYNCYCISFDNRWFFDLEKTDKFEVAENLEKLVVEMTEADIPSSYSKCLWNDHKQNVHFDLYRDYDMTELDPEVKELVFALNKFEGMKTVSSCCGHGEIPLHIYISFSKFLPLCFLAKVLNNKFKEDFVLTTRKNINNTHVDNIIMSLETTVIGEEAYQKANLLAKELNRLESVLQ